MKKRAVQACLLIAAALELLTTNLTELDNGTVALFNIVEP